MPPSPTDHRPAPHAAREPARDRSTGPADVDLLGVVAALELSAFLRLSALAPTGPALVDVRGLARIAVDHLARHERVADHLAGLGADVEGVVGPWRAPLEAFHHRMAPSTWGEAVVGAYVGDAVTSDVCAALAAGAGGETSALLLRVLGPPPQAPEPPVTDGAGAPGGAAVDVGDPAAPPAPGPPPEGVAAFAVPALARVVAADPLATGRLSLWGRRLVGEALGQAQAVLVARPGLRGLLEGPRPSGATARAPVTETFARVAQAHVARMVRLGLAP